MVKLKLRRQGKKKQPTYRLVAADSHSPRDGRFIEILGHYNPRTDPPTLVMKEDRILDWLKQGAQPTDSVRQLLNTAGILRRAEEAPPRTTKTDKVVSARKVAAPVTVEVKAEAVVGAE